MRNAWSMSHIDAVIDDEREAKAFTTMNLTSGY